LRSQTGRAGEEFACQYLSGQGYEILHRNFHTRYGEIDIIAQKDGFLVFAEVKARAPNALFPAQMAVTQGKRNKIIKSAYIYLEKEAHSLQPRFDVLALTVGEGNQVLDFEHYINAFDGF